ncbi:T9SS type A sorting domain-containing protein [Hymenobacter sp. IS2118]|uniref:T9SS type A sorting domain-containing protein n=1 Tax=Hymenobacter sp. IS2118 TaxID=1505605 RepID=UPI00054E543B|nr:T9SS type A sorting domain-containing protein [Hymenobacter sp. IS2118]
MPLALFPSKLILVRPFLLGLLLLVAAHAQAQTPAWQSAVRLTSFNYSSGSVSAAVTNAAGDVFIAGSFAGALDLSGIVVNSLGDYDGFVAKWSAAANRFVWVQRIGGSSTENATGLAVNGSNVYVVGSFISPRLYVGASTVPLQPSGGGYDAYVVKLTDAGTSSTYTWGLRAGGHYYDVALGVAVNGASVYVAGYMGNTTNLTFGTLAQPQHPASSSSIDGFVAKLTDAGATGAFNWVQTVAGAESEYVASVAVNGSSVYVMGIFSSPTALVGSLTLANAGGTTRAADTFVAKFTDAGTSAGVGWAQRMGGSTVTPLALAVNGPRVYVAGKFYGTALFGTTSLAAYNSSSGFVSGFVTRLTDTGSAGTVGWAVRMGSTANFDYTAQSLAAHSTGVYVAGLCGPNADLTVGTLVAPAGPTSSYVAKLTDTGTTGAFTWAQRGGGLDGNGAGAVAVSPGGRVYVGGSYKYAGVFGATTLADPSTFQLNIGYLAYLQDVPLATASTRPLQTGLSIFPNPAHGRATVQWPARLGGSQAVLTVRDALGRAVRTQNVAVAAAGGNQEVSVAGLPAGRYVLQVQVGHQVWSQQLQVQ